MTKIPTLSLFAEILEVRQGLIIWVVWKGIKGVGKDIHYSSQNAALFVDLL